MNQIASLLPLSNIALDLDAGTKVRLFEEMGILFERTAGISRATVAASLAAREKLGSTGLGQGIAIPHGRIKGLTTAIGAFVRPLAPIPFDAPDGRPVAQAFVLLVPEKATEEHLQLLSQLAQMFSDKTFRDRLAASTAAEDLHALFTDWTPNAQ